MLDLIIRRANLPDGRTDIDIGVRQGRVAVLQPAREAEAATEIDASGRLVSPPFVDPHFHMDATLSLGLPRLGPRIASELAIPVALISTSTSPARGPSSPTSIISSGFPAANATAARVSWSLRTLR